MKLTTKEQYSKLGDHIVEQAFRSYPAVLTDELRKKLFEDKIERARQELEIRKRFPSFV